MALLTPTTRAQSRSIYQFGESQVVPKAKLSHMIQAIISSLMSPDSETIPNTLVLVAHGTTGDLRRLEEMRIKLPHNLLIVDTMAFERQLYSTGQRGAMQEPSGKAREQGSSLSLAALLQSLGVDVQRVLHNAGNAAFMCLLGLQTLLDPDTKPPVPRMPKGISPMLRGPSWSPSMAPGIPFVPTPPVFPQMGLLPPGSPVLFPRLSTPDIVGDAGTNGRMSYFPNHRSISDQRLTPPIGSFNGRMPGRARVNSTNDVNEMGENLAAMHLKSKTDTAD
ncbi:hypothetical protein TRAPUB_6434 [Trametes pubescens]|uniref:Gfd2/YDR514C-like C-terminal domain-containing protein n=1 Tax=Trametes pubescens TaxID=154538 RepID=A0A1M2V673_TRAPU|nr:hypothetical protein TRAPUB_6434 [Trametes pubescens]